MGNRVTQTILDEKIEMFKLSFEKTSKEIFWDETEQKLIHPSEYGTYREAICKDFLRLLTPEYLEINTGFLINTSEEISTQCDIVIFDSQSSPLIENTERQRFYPVETTVAIGEIKSTMSKSEFKSAINKLARNKRMREQINGSSSIKRKHEGEFNPKEYIYDNLFSFLICKKLNFNIDNLPIEINSYYESDIEPRQKHNLILSIDDGLLAYIDGNGKTLMYPWMPKDGALRNRFVIPDDNKDIHFHFFSSYFFMSTSSISIYFPDLSLYLTNIKGGINKDEQKNGLQQSLK